MSITARRFSSFCQARERARTHVKGHPPPPAAFTPASIVPQTHPHGGHTRVEGPTRTGGHANGRRPHTAGKAQAGKYPHGGETSVEETPRGDTGRRKTPRRENAGGRRAPGGVGASVGDRGGGGHPETAKTPPVREVFLFCRKSGYVSFTLPGRRLPRRQLRCSGWSALR